MSDKIQSMDNEDKKIISEYLAGDEDAFEELINRYLKPIYNFIFQLTGDLAVADDLTQETFVKAWKNIRRFDQNKSFKTWIFTISKNTTWDYLKKKKTIPFSSFTDEEGYNQLENIAEAGVLPDEMLMRSDAAEILEKKLKELPEQYRLVLTLHYKEDFSFSEIAEVLKVPYNTIKSQHQRGLMQLKNLWEK